VNDCNLLILITVAQFIFVAQNMSSVAQFLFVAQKFHNFVAQL